MRLILILLTGVGLWTANRWPCAAAPKPLQPKTSQHASFKPEKFERVAIIVKPITKTERATFRYGSAAPTDAQGQIERLIEQNFMRVLIGGGYTLVSRGDLDAAMKEKGLDQANLTDEERDQQAGKLLHVSSLLIVTVDNFKTTGLQASAPAAPSYSSYSGGNSSRSRSRMFSSPPSYSYSSRANTQQYFQVLATVSARLVKIDDNMVVWTGDLTVNQTLATQDQDAVVLANVAEAIAKTFPPLTPPATNPGAAPGTNAPAALKP